MSVQKAGDGSGDYAKFRGKCKALCEKDQSLRLVRGWYNCPMWGRQQHWWCVDQNGSVVDPTARQFPSKGIGEYEEFNGIVNCEYCGKELPESQAYIYESHVYC